MSHVQLYDDLYVSEDHISYFEDLVCQLSDCVSINEKRINDLIREFDFKLRLPKEIASEASGREAEDSLRYVLNQKFNLDKIELQDPALEQIENPRVKMLLSDIKKLNMIRESKIERNVELKKALTKYEDFIQKTVMPYLRKDMIDQQGLNSFRARESYDQNEAEKKKIWQKYVEYTIYLQKLFTVSYKLTIMLETLYKDGEIPKFELTLEKIRQLRSKIQEEIASSSRLYET